MVSGIVLIKQYITEPVFEHYFEPVFKNSGIYISDRHFFGRCSSKEKALLALRGNVSKDIIYGIMNEAVHDVEKENEEKKFRDLHKSQRPTWAHLVPSIIDNSPDIIGLYAGDETASKFFETVGLEYIAKDISESVSESVRDMEDELRGLGEKFSEF